jgi:hypothetical protein
VDSRDNLGIDFASLLARHRSTRAKLDFLARQEKRLNEFLNRANACHSPLARSPQRLIQKSEEK